LTSPNKVVEAAAEVVEVGEGMAAAVEDTEVAVAEVEATEVTGDMGVAVAAAGEVEVMEEVAVDTEEAAMEDMEVAAVAVGSLNHLCHLHCIVKSQGQASDHPCPDCSHKIVILETKRCLISIFKYCHCNSIRLFLNHSLLNMASNEVQFIIKLLNKFPT
jgi:hypothetical protein